MSRRRAPRQVYIHELDIGRLGPQDISDIKSGYRVAFIGRPGQGKTKLMQDFMYSKRHIVASLRAHTGSEESKKDFEKLIHPIFVNDEIDLKNMETLTNLEKRQNMAIRYLEPAGHNPWHMELTDDFAYKKELFKTEYYAKKNRNSRHWRLIDVLSVQTADDLPKDAKQCLDGVFIFKTPQEKFRKILFENFGAGLEYREFCDLMDQVHAEEFTTLFIDLRTQSSEIEDIYSYYKANLQRIPKDFKPGCYDYWNHGAQRYHDGEHDQHWS